MEGDPAPEGRRPHEASPATARPAASLILLRDTDFGIETLMVRRNPSQRFMGGAWVFPGGAVDATDADPRAAALRELAEEAGVELDPGTEAVALSRWVTPVGVSKRFDTWFFVARAPEDVTVVVDGSECVDAQWIAPARALEQGRDGGLALVFPTVKHLELLAERTSVASVVEWARGRRVEPVLPRMILDGDVQRVVLPGEPGYAD